MYDSDELDCCTPNEVFCYRIKSFYLYKLYKYALKYYDTIKSFSDIAALALLEVNKQLDMYDEILDNDPSQVTSIVTTPDTILHWFRQYRSLDCFVNTKALNINSEKLPPFLAANPDAVSEIIYLL